MAKGLPVSFRLEAAEKLALDRAAEAENRSVSNLLTVIVREWLAQRERGGGGR